MLSFVLAKARTKDNNAMRFVSPNRTNLFFAYYLITDPTPGSSKRDGESNEGDRESRRARGEGAWRLGQYHVGRRSYSASFWSILSLAKGRLMSFTLMITEAPLTGPSL